jgi:sortase B
MKSAWRNLRIALVVLCTAVFVVSGVFLVKILIGYASADKTYEEINRGFETLSGSETESKTDGIETETESGSTEEAPFAVTVHDGLTAEMQAQYDYFMELKKTYPDVVGYVSIPSISINYPVVQTTDNDYYLNHLITGEVSTSGSIFLDYRCPSDATGSRNTVLYGHNMNNGSMFHNVQLLFTPEEFAKATVEYICEEGILMYKPLTVYRADAMYPFMRRDFVDEADYLDYCRMVVEKSHLTESERIEYAADSGLVTLVTCTNSVSSKTGRYIYQAVLDSIYYPISE